jgi:hypothetical protein
LIRLVLCDTVRWVQPSPYVYEKIKQTVRCRMTGEAERYALIGVWDWLKHSVGRRMASKGGWHVGRGLYQPGIFGVSEGFVPLSLVYIIEQPMSMLGVGWAT